MKYITYHICCVLLGLMVFSVAQAQDSDHGYECYNMQIAQQMFVQARNNNDIKAMREARILIRNRKKFCTL